MGQARVHPPGGGLQFTWSFKVSPSVIAWWQALEREGKGSFVKGSFRRERNARGAP